MTLNKYTIHRTPPSSYMKFRKTTWRLIGSSVYYGMLIQIGTIQAKALLCRLCRSYFRDIKTGDFWLLLGGFIVLFSFLNILLAATVRRVMFSGYPVSPTKEHMWCCGIRVAKVTRSGAVYGYM
ncbi:uncharacterized protein LOC127863313 [Dreissena polymorpha]|nr:uncharacterized protein LOC127863313 [Dreissena polymorpha]